MKKILSSLIALVMAICTTQAQTMNVVTGDVTYQFPATSAGDMTYSNNG